MLNKFMLCYVKYNFNERDMRFPTMWYVRPAKPLISLHMCLKDVKFWVEPSENSFKISSPRVPAKTFCLYMCYHILHIV